MHVLAPRAAVEVSLRVAVVDREVHRRGLAGHVVLGVAVIVRMPEAALAALVRTPRGVLARRHGRVHVRRGESVVARVAVVVGVERHVGPVRQRARGPPADRVARRRVRHASSAKCNGNNSQQLSPRQFRDGILFSDEPPMGGTLPMA